MFWVFLSFLFFQLPDIPVMYLPRQEAHSIWKVKPFFLKKKHTFCTPGCIFYSFCCILAPLFPLDWGWQRRQTELSDITSIEATSFFSFSFLYFSSTSSPLAFPQTLILFFNTYLLPLEFQTEQILLWLPLWLVVNSSKKFSRCQFQNCWLAPVFFFFSFSLSLSLFLTWF